MRRLAGTMITAAGILGAVCLAESHYAAGGTSWPVVRPLHESFIISTPPRAVVKTFTRDQAGKARYLFVCRNAEDESVPGVIYSGDLDCRLLAAEWGEIGANLLVESHAPNIAPWYSRGRMVARELYADCASYPEYGRVRHFRLRGMKITMEFDDIRFVPVKGNPSPRLASYTLRLTVEPDSSATRDIAESSGFLDPSVQRPDDPRSCAVVRSGNEWGDQ